VQVGRDLISRVTDAVMEDVREWQQRPLDDVYPVVFLDALVLKVREGGSVQRRACYLALGVTVEGERDDICAVGQTLAAHDLCSSLRPYRKRHHMQAGVGHYGVFSGKRWESQIYPLVKNVILSSE